MLNQPVPSDPSAVSDYLFRKLQGFYELGDETRKSLSSAFAIEQSFEAGSVMASEGEPYRAIFLIKTGWVFRARHLESGLRQIVNVALPGDFLCFNATLFGTNDFDLVARTAVTAFRVEVQTFTSLMLDHAHLALALAWANAHEESLLAERIVSLGRRNARERTAHVLCEFATRLKMLGMIAGNSMRIPLTQADFADILGMSLIHVSRTFRSLVQSELISYRAGQVEIHDFARLKQVAGFDEEYLHFTQRKDVFGRL